MRRHPILTLVLVAILAAPLRAQAPERTYFEFQVTKAVRALPSAKGPRYPAEQRAAGVSGTVLAQFVVDTMGVPMMSTFKVLKSDHEAFSSAVRTWLETARFEPAELEGRKVRQLAQQPYVFAIAGADSIATTSYRSNAPRPALEEMYARLPLTPKPSTGTVDGWALEWQTTMSDSSGKTVMSFKTRWTGTADRIRLNMLSSAMTDGIVMILQGDSGTTGAQMVMPMQKSVMLVRVPSVPDALGILPPKFDNVTTTDLGAGERIHGFSTRHFRQTAQVRASVVVGDSVCTIVTPYSAELWVSNDATLSAAAEKLARLRTVLPSLGSADPSARVRASTPLPGALVRWTGGALMMVDGMRSPYHSSTIEITEAYVGPVDASLFDAPEGYRIMDMSAIQTPRSDSLARSIFNRSRQLGQLAAPEGGTRTCKLKGP